MSIRELTWQIKYVVFEAQNFTGFLPFLRLFDLKTYEISDLGQLGTDLRQVLNKTRDKYLNPYYLSTTAYQLESKHTVVGCYLADLELS